MLTKWEAMTVRVVATPLPAQWMLAIAHAPMERKLKTAYKPAGKWQCHIEVPMMGSPQSGSVMSYRTHVAAMATDFLQGRKCWYVLMSVPHLMQGNKYIFDTLYSVRLDMDEMR